MYPNKEDTGDAAEMPRYQCHKKVWALKIASITLDTDINNDPDGTAWIAPVDLGYAPFQVGAEYLEKHKPQAG